LFGRVKGPYPDNPGRVSFGNQAEAADKVLSDFAVEVRAQATESTLQARYGIVFFLANRDPARGDIYNDAYSFNITPGFQSYNIFGGRENRVLAQARTTALNRPEDQNLLRMEVRADTMEVSINGRLVDRVQHGGLARRGGTIRLAFLMGWPPGDGDVEVRFTDFKVLSWES
jgi:hypothetical protein